MHFKSITFHPYSFPVYTILHTCIMSTASNSSVFLHTSQQPGLKPFMLFKSIYLNSGLLWWLHSEGMLSLSWLKQRSYLNSVNQVNCLKFSGQYHAFQWGFQKWHMNFPSIIYKESPNLWLLKLSSLGNYIPKLYIRASCPD